MAETLFEEYPALDLGVPEPAPVHHQPWDSGFIRRLLEARLRRGYHSQREWAKWSGFSERAIATWESGASIPRGDSLLLICRNLRVSADWLLGLKTKAPRRFCRILMSKRR